MPKAALIQMACGEDIAGNVARATELVGQAAAQGARLVCLPEMFFCRFFAQSVDRTYSALAEPVPGPLTERMTDVAKRHAVVLIVPVYEAEAPEIYYNTAAVIDAEGTYLGKYRKSHIPFTPAFQEKFYFKPGNLPFRAFETKAGKVGLLICYDRHFPEAARLVGLHGAEFAFVPTATSTRGLSPMAWEIELRAHAIANGYFVGGVNRVGREGDLEYYGRSLFIDPMGRILAEAPTDRDAVLVADLDPALITEARNLWQFYRDRRPEMYGDLARLL